MTIVFKTIGINALLAQSIHTVLAKEFFESWVLEEVYLLHLVVGAVEPCQSLGMGDIDGIEVVVVAHEHTQFVVMAEVEILE